MGREHIKLERLLYMLVGSWVTILVIFITVWLWLMTNDSYEIMISPREILIFHKNK